MTRTSLLAVVLAAVFRRRRPPAAARGYLVRADRIRAHKPGLRHGRAGRPDHAVRRRAGRDDRDRARAARRRHVPRHPGRVEERRRARACSRWRSARTTRRTTSSTSRTSDLQGNTEIARVHARTAASACRRAAKILLDRPAAVLEPQGRPAAVRHAQGYLYVGLRRRRYGSRRGDISTGEPEYAQNGPARSASSCDPPNEPGGPGRRSGSACATRGGSRSTGRRTTSGSATSARPLGGGRFPPDGKVGALAELRLEPLRGPRPSTTSAVACSRAKGVLVAPVWTYFHNGPGVRRRRRLRVPRRERAGGARPLLLRRLLRGRDLDVQGRAERPHVRVSRCCSGTVPDLSSFGQDASGELYAVSLDGGLYALR